MKIVINGKKFEEIKEVDNFTDLLLYLNKKLENKDGKIVYFDYSNGILINGNTINNDNIDILIETEEQYNNRIIMEKLKEVV